MYVCMLQTMLNGKSLSEIHFLLTLLVEVYMCGPSHNACVTGPTLSHDIEMITFVINDIHDPNMKQIGNRIRTDLKDGNRNARLALSA